MKKRFSLRLILLSLTLLSSCQHSVPSSSMSLSSFSSVSSSETENESSSPSSFSSSEESISSLESSSSELSSSESSLTSVSSEEESSYFYDGYYQSLSGLASNQVFSALRTLLRSALVVDGLQLAERLPKSYGDARTLLAETDRDPTDATKLILVYRQTSVPSVWDGGATWNREHVWPQSLMYPNLSTENSDRHRGADLHNLKPANPSENTSRGNKYFGETTTSQTYAPPQNVKGDLARILFYMTTMYPELSLINVALGGGIATYQMAPLDLLVGWHLLDPVDAFERNRNEVIYFYQGNRNPYIDHEELVCRVWEQATVVIQNLCHPLS